MEPKKPRRRTDWEMLDDMQDDFPATEKDQIDDELLRNLRGYDGERR